MLQKLIKAPGHLTNDDRYEYLVLTSLPKEPKNIARAALREHCDNGKWELVRSVRFEGGGSKYWMRRKVIKVTSTLTRSGI